MSYSYTYQETVTFTATHARHMAAKVATDLKRIQRFYNAPSDKSIAEYQIEIIELLKAGYLGTITFGFKKDGNWIEPTVRYTARDLSGRGHDQGRDRGLSRGQRVARGRTPAGRRPARGLSAQ